jgi:hypothetical protein
MVKVITFSLWGDNKTYTIGAIKNAEFALEYYPDFECWFYIHKESVPIDIVIELEKIKNVKIIFKYGKHDKPRMWRFEAIDDDNVEIMMSRDTDTRFLLREKLAVDEWLNSGKKFHIMRDHPHHGFKILGGMFGTCKIDEIKSWKYEMEKYIKNHEINYDQDFLRDIVYPNIKNNVLVHATFHKFETESKDFPIKYDNEYRFVGEYVYHDESRSQYHIDCLISDMEY